MLPKVFPFLFLVLIFALSCGQPSDVSPGVGAGNEEGELAGTGTTIDQALESCPDALTWDQAKRFGNGESIVIDGLSFSARPGFSGQLPTPELSRFLLPEPAYDGSAEQSSVDSQRNVVCAYGITTISSSLRSLVRGRRSGTSLRTVQISAPLPATFSVVNIVNKNNTPITDIGIFGTGKTETAVFLPILNVGDNEALLASETQIASTDRKFSVAGYSGSGNLAECTNLELGKNYNLTFEGSKFIRLSCSAQQAR